jgi:hypothetical protein
MEVGHTSRGFERIEFKDRYGQECYLQQSSIADYEPPGSSAIWFGVMGRSMHISLAQIQELLPHLLRWCEAGTFVLEEALPNGQKNADQTGASRLRQVET